MHTVQILRLFPTIDGGAFFTLLRLVLHMQADSGIDRSMVFVQVSQDYRYSVPACVGDAC
jgi:hypothetical protein